MTTSVCLSTDERATLEALVDAMGARSLSDGLRLLIAGGAATYGIPQPRRPRRLRSLPKRRQPHAE